MRSHKAIYARHSARDHAHDKIPRYLHEPIHAMQSAWGHILEIIYTSVTIDTRFHRLSWNLVGFGATPELVRIFGCDLMVESSGILPKGSNRFPTYLKFWDCRKPWIHNRKVSSPSMWVALVSGLVGDGKIDGARWSGSKISGEKYKSSCMFCEQSQSRSNSCHLL